MRVIKKYWMLNSDIKNGVFMSKTKNHLMTLIEDAFEELNSNEVPEGKLYHYMSINNFMNTLNNRKIYFSDSRFLNDPNEGNNLEIINGILGEILNTEKSDSLVNSIIKEVQETINGNRDYIDDGYYRPRYYLKCFSESEDDLTLWKMYTQEMKGICLEVDLSKGALFNSASLFKIIYNKDDFKKLIYRKLNKIFENQDVIINSGFDFVVCDFISFIEKMLIKSKNTAFSYEKEWRFVEKITDSSMHDSILRHCSNNDEISSFINFEIDMLKLIDTGVISKLILGPNTTDTTLIALGEYFSDKNTFITIKRSEIRIR